jgi:hypothetical protein
MFEKIAQRLGILRRRLVGAGLTPTLQDNRIAWAIETLGGVSGKRVLDLEPMEGGHTHMLERAGASSVTAIEASEEYLRRASERFDVVIACGVLYHMKNPVEVIQNMARIADSVYVWTHYCIPERMAAISHMKGRYSHWLGREDYLGAMRHAGFNHFTIEVDDVEHVNGPCISLIAHK